MTKRSGDERGLILILAIVLTAAMALMGLSLMSQSTSQYSLTASSSARANATYTAEAGVERSVQALNLDSAFSGYGSTQEFFDNQTQGYGTYTTTVTPAPGNANAKVITSDGTVSRFNDRSRVVARQTVQVTVVGTGSEGYSVITGPGGLILNGSANITNSPVFVGGTITLTGSSKIGTTSKPLQIDVSNKACPTGSNPGASYPSVCTGNEQPISLDYSTAIYGSVCATGQTTTGPNNNIKPGNGGQGLILGCTAPDITTPTFDKAALLAGVTTTANATDSAYACSGSQTRIWPAGLKLVGDVSISNSCKLTIGGDVYITGKLTFAGSATVKVDDSLGTNRPTILADGIVNVGGSAAITANTSGTGPEIVSYASNAPCASSCTSLSGSALKTSSSYETIKVDGSAKVPGVIFNAQWGKVTIGGSGNVGAATGQTVDLSGSGTITFGTVLATGSSTWTITSYQIRYP